MRELVLDASFALRWCFEDEATAETESLLTSLQNQQAIAWVPGIWPYEMLNGLGKGVTRQRLKRNKAFLLRQEIQALPIRISEVQADEKLLELALQHNLAVYDASYLSLVQARALPIATVDGNSKTLRRLSGFKSSGRKAELDTPPSKSTAGRTSSNSSVKKTSGLAPRGPVLNSVVLEERVELS